MSCGKNCIAKIISRRLFAGRGGQIFGVRSSAQIVYFATAQRQGHRSTAVASVFSQTWSVNYVV